MLQVLIPIEIAKNSINYWHDNIKNWYEVFNGTNSLKDLDSFNWSWPWRTLALNDAEGAVATAASLAVNGTGEALIAAGPDGWLAGGMVLAAGGLGSSGIAFYNWYLSL